MHDGNVEPLEVPRVAGGKGAAPGDRDARDHRVAQIDRAPGLLTGRGEPRGNRRRAGIEVEDAARARPAQVPNAGVSVKTPVSRCPES